MCGSIVVSQARRGSSIRGAWGFPTKVGPGAFWAILDGEVELRETAYPVEPALERLGGVGFPGFEQTFASPMRGEVTAESASEHFESQRDGA